MHWPARWVRFVKSSSQNRHIRERLGACPPLDTHTLDDGASHLANGRCVYEQSPA